ncbi:hypothetical protein CIHG_10150, partial [Coccidioides immitis H538.4]
MLIWPTLIRRIPAPAPPFKIGRLALALLWQWHTLVLGISAKIGLNYFGLIDMPDCSAPAATTCHLHAAPAPPTTAAAAPPPPPPPTTASLPPPGAIRVSACQMT